MPGLGNSGAKMSKFRTSMLSKVPSLLESSLGRGRKV